MSCGVSNDATGHAVAKQKAAQIELDVQAGSFDPTLLKYKPRLLGKTATVSHMLQDTQLFLTPSQMGRITFP
jgi:hypothetical protein